MRSGGPRIDGLLALAVGCLLIAAAAMIVLAAVWTVQ